MVYQTIIFVFSIWKLFWKMGAKHVKYKNYYLKASFKFNFLKIVFTLFWKQNKKILLSIKPKNIYLVT